MKSQVVLICLKKYFTVPPISGPTNVFSNFPLDLSSSNRFHHLNWERPKDGNYLLITLSSWMPPLDRRPTLGWTSLTQWAQACAHTWTWESKEVSMSFPWHRTPFLHACFSYEIPSCALIHNEPYPTRQQSSLWRQQEFGTEVWLNLVTGVLHPPCQWLPPRHGIYLATYLCALSSTSQGTGRQVTEHVTVRPGKCNPLSCQK